MKKYSMISIIFIGIVGLLTYINTNATTTFNLFGINITLLNAIWSMIFLSIFYLISIVYFSIEKYKSYKFHKNIKKDKENLIKNIESKILYKTNLQEIKELSEIQEFIEMIEGLKIIPTTNKNFPFLDELIKIENGEVVELKKYKLDEKNPWVLKNLENKLKNEDLDSAKKMLNTPLKDKAIQLLSKKADVNEILANNYPITKEIILNNLEHKRIDELINKSNLKNEEYIEIAQQLYKTTKVPENLLNLFEKKTYPYIYLLIEYEMIDKAMELAREHDIKIFEYYLLLRENGVKVDIKEFLNAKL